MSSHKGWASYSGLKKVGFESNLAKFEWHVFPSSKMSVVDPCPSGTCSYSGVNKQAGAISAWSGGAYDTKRDRLMVWGGGHNNYGGNEVYAFDLAAGTWSRLTEPHPVDAADRSDGIAGSTNTSGYYHDGTPASYHTSNALTYAANVDSLFSLSGGSFGGNAVRRFQADSLDLATNAWKTDWTTPPNLGNPRAMAAYDSVNGSIWYHAAETGARLAELTGLAGGVGTWTLYGPATGVTLYATPAIDTLRHRMVSIGGSAGRQMFAWDLNNPAAARTIPVTSGDAGGIALESVGGTGFIYDPIGDQFIAWDGGATLYRLDPATWVWSVLANAAGNTVTPTAKSPLGTYGRFRYVPSAHGLVVVNATNENVYFYKL